MKRSAVKKKSPRKLTAKLKAKTAPRGKDDIIPLILEHHKPLKRLIKTLKDSDADLPERRQAFVEFAPLLVSHAKAEEQTLYVYMKSVEDLRTEGFEGDVEHGIADQMVEEAKRTDDEDLWTARVKVLAELVEHHIKEEEDDMLPDFKKKSEPAERAKLAQDYTRLRDQLLSQGGEDAPSERNAPAKRPASAIPSVSRQ